MRISAIVIAQIGHRDHPRRVGAERRPTSERSDGCRSERGDAEWMFRSGRPAELYSCVNDEVFPFLRELGGEDSADAEHMRDAIFMVPNPQLLRDVFDLVDELEIADRDAKGDLYEYMLSKLQTAGQNGQFRTPRHIIRMMVELVAPMLSLRSTVHAPRPHRNAPRHPVGWLMRRSRQVGGVTGPGEP